MDKFIDLLMSYNLWIRVVVGLVLTKVATPSNFMYKYMSHWEDGNIAYRFPTSKQEYEYPATLYFDLMHGRFEVRYLVNIKTPGATHYLCQHDLPNEKPINRQVIFPTNTEVLPSFVPQQTLHQCVHLSFYFLACSSGSKCDFDFRPKECVHHRMFQCKVRIVYMYSYNVMISIS